MINLLKIRHASDILQQLNVTEKYYFLILILTDKNQGKISSTGNIFIG